RIFTRFGLIVAAPTYIDAAAVDKSLRTQARHDIRGAEIFTSSIAAPLQLELAFGETLGANQNLPGNADQIRCGELGSGALVGIVIKHLDPFGSQLAIKPFACRVGFLAALLQIQDRCPERGDCFRPFDAGVVVTSLDYRADQT